MEWKIYQLKDVCSRLSSGKNIKAANVLQEGPYPVYGGNGLRGYSLTSNFKGSCAIIGRQGAYCGNVRYFNGEAHMTEHAVVVQGNELADNYYLSCLLSTMHLERLSGQSAQPGLAVGTLAVQEIDLPSIEDQRRIANILSSLDRKIELNNKINAQLEEMAQAIFKSWFVDFEPFKVGADGSAPTHGSGKFVESELGMIPEGWRVGTLGEICVLSKKKIRLKSLTEETYFSTENMLQNKQGVCKASFLPNIEYATECIKYDVLISNIRPYFKKIHRVVGVCGCSNDVLCFHSKALKWNSYMYRALYDDKFFDYVMSGAKGTKMPRGDKNQIMKFQIVLPDDNSLLEFSRIIEPIYNLVLSNQNESLHLSHLRDTLLPKLMSGEIEI